jgi:CTD kinase subunit gamma
LERSLSEREEVAITEIARPGDGMQLDRADGIHELDEKDIEQRMEEDRERHKRKREETWAVDPDSELDQLYDSGQQGLTEKLLQDCKDDERERKVAVELDEMNYRGGTPKKSLTP